jgi:hypothetical protein
MGIVKLIQLVFRTALLSGVIVFGAGLSLILSNLSVGKAGKN